MGFFDFLSGSDEAQTAADQNRQALANMQAQQNALYAGYQQQALGTLGQSRDAALGALSGGLQNQVGAFGSALGATQGVSTGPLQDAIAAQQAGLTGALQAGQGAVGSYDTLQNLGQSYDPAVQQYYAALGLKGQDAAAAARANFLPGTGYQFQQDEATRQALAQASKLGIAQSGNTANALIGRAGDLAGSQWNDYLNRLQGFVNPQLQAIQGAATGRAGAYGQLGQLGLSGSQNVATAQGNLFAGNRGLASDITGIYGNLAGAYGTNAAQQASTQTGYGQDVSNVLGNAVSGQAQTARDVVQGNIAANNQIAQAGQQDASNLWGLLGAGVGAAGRALGGRAP